MSTTDDHADSSRSNGSPSGGSPSGGSPSGGSPSGGFPPGSPPSADRITDERGVRSLADVQTALEFGHPVLGDVGSLLSNLHVAPTGASDAADANGVSNPPHSSGASDASDTADSGRASPAQSSGESTPTRLAEDLSSHAAMVDRLRAHELVHVATTALTLALTRRGSEDRLADLFTDEGPVRAGTDDTSSEGANPDGAATSLSAPASGVDATSLSLEDPERFLTRAEYLLEREHEAVLNVRLNARTGDSRRRVGLALTAYIGMPLLLRSMLAGEIRFNRWEGLTRKLKHLPLTHLHALDVFLAGLDPRYSLGQFLQHAASFLAQFETKPVLAARARTERSVWVEHLPDGLAIHCMKGPAALIEARHAASRAAASAIWKNQLTTMTVTRAGRPLHTDGGSGPTDADELPDLSRLSRADDRSIRQLMFDVLIGATPRTQTVLERLTENGEPAERYHVDIECPDEATLLRKRATVVVTVPMTTLLGLDDRPGTIAGEPIPADMARSIAGSSKFWYRMLTDPATGQVLDEVALKYKPDKATRLSVLGKWRTCTLPGCSRPAQECEIDHGIPFNHEHPERGGRTEPANLHPLCVAHHQAKTEGRIRMRRTTDGGVDWLLPLGTTATTVAPSLDDGGILTAACAPADSEARRDARHTIERRTIRDPQTNRRVADAAFDQAGREFYAAEHARSKRQTVRAAEAADIVREQIRVQSWEEEARQELRARTDRLREQEAHVRKRERNVARDERLASLAHARAEAKLEEATRRAAPSAPPRPAAERVRYRTLIPMRIEHFEFGHGRTGSLYTPVFFGAQPLRTGEDPRDSTTHDEQSGSDDSRSDARLSAVEDEMASSLHDACARQQIVIVDERFDQYRPPEPSPTSQVEPQPETRPQTRPETETETETGAEPTSETPSADDVDDDPPPF